MPGDKEVISRRQRIALRQEILVQDSELTMTRLTTVYSILGI